MGDPVYLKVSTSIIDAFTYLNQNALRTPVTGKVDGDFTKTLSKDGVGNQSVTGITIAEIDATNNAGEYSISIASTAFPAATGKYMLRVKDSVNTQFSWTWTFWVTTDGLASGTIGPALFTPIAGNGRIVDSLSAAILGATIIVRTSTGLLYYSSTTDSSGLWGPINFPAANATYTIYAIRSGYQQATGTITVAAGIATGPGADLTMTAATTSTGFLASDFWAYIRRQARNTTGTTATTEIQQIATEAMERIATCHRWPWYRTYGELLLYGNYTTGTVTLTNGSTTATLAAGTWPTWVAAGCKLFVLGQVLEVASRTSGSVIVLASAWNETTASGLGYNIYKDAIALPDDMYAFGLVLPGQRWGYGSRPIGMERLDQYQNAMSTGQKFSDFFAIQKQSIYLSMHPTVDTQVRYSYYRRPANLVSGTDVVDWDPAHVRLLRRAADIEVASRFGGYAGGSLEQARANFMEALKDAIPNDRSEAQEAAVLGTAFSARSGGVDWRQRSD